jgi:hypothetical protein
MNFRTLVVSTRSVVPAVASLRRPQVPVARSGVSADATSIVVKKGDNWEIARGDDKTDLKPGDKVTIEYTMTAKKVEVKPASSSSSKKKAK